jgi:hypothetical protein
MLHKHFFEGDRFAGRAFDAEFPFQNRGRLGRLMPQDRMKRVAALAIGQAAVQSNQTLVAGRGSERHLRERELLSQIAQTIARLRLTPIRAYSSSTVWFP